MMKRNSFSNNRFRTVVGIKINYVTLLTLCWGADICHEFPILEDLPIPSSIDFHAISLTYF